MEPRYHQHRNSRTNHVHVHARSGTMRDQRIIDHYYQSSNNTIIHGYRLPTAEDTAAIRRVAPGPGERVAPQRVEPLRIVADTAWITVWKHVDIPSVNGSTAGSGVIPRVVRLERRKGSWMVVRKEASR